MTNTRESFWTEYYEAVAKKGDHWLDYSNERVQAQTFGIVIGALGPLAGRVCLDVGCGFGQLARALNAFGAASVTGIDISAELISQLQDKWPNIQFERGSLSDASFRAALGQFDRITLVEVLQYLPIRETLTQAFQMLRPEGRLVLVVPNRECPIVTRAVERFGGNYGPPSPQELVEIASDLTGSGRWALSGMWFGANQVLDPYVVAPLSPAISKQTPGADVPGPMAPPNRLVLAIQK